MLHIELPTDSKGNIDFCRLDCYELCGAIEGFKEKRRRLNGRLHRDDQDRLDELEEVRVLAQERGFCLDRPRLDETRTDRPSIGILTIVTEDDMNQQQTEPEFTPQREAEMRLYYWKQPNSVLAGIVAVMSKDSFHGWRKDDHLRVIGEIGDIRAALVERDRLEKQDDVDGVGDIEATLDHHHPYWRDLVGEQSITTTEEAQQ